MAYHQQMQKLFHQYQKEVCADPTDLHEVADWAIRKDYWKPRQADVQQRFANDMADALRQEYKVDVAGRSYRVNHAVRGTKNGKQMSLWGDIDTAPVEHMQKAFAQRRRHVVGECYQLKLDVDHFNDIHTEEQVQLVLDFTDDVAEQMVANGLDDAA